MYTLGGGLSEPRASLLASKGYVVLALAYYGYKGLPKNPQNLDLEYFEEAVTYLKKRPEVSINNVLNQWSPKLGSGPRLTIINTSKINYI